MSKYYEYSSKRDKDYSSECYEYTICPKKPRDDCSESCIQGPPGPQGLIGLRGATGPMIRFDPLSAFESYEQGVVPAKIGVPKIYNFQSNMCGIEIVDDVISILKSGYYYIASGSPEAFFEMIDLDKENEYRFLSYLPKGGGQLFLNMLVEVTKKKVKKIKVTNIGKREIDSKGNKYAAGSLLIYKYQDGK